MFPGKGLEVEAPRASAGFQSYISKDYELLGDADKAGQLLGCAVENGFGKGNQILHDLDMKKIGKDPCFDRVDKETAC